MNPEDLLQPIFGEGEEEEEDKLLIVTKQYGRLAYL
jgi:hypothetical protein